MGHNNIANKLAFQISKIHFNEDYHPSENTRLTTNFANLARGEARAENLRKTLNMINQKFNARANWDNADGNRYSVQLEIVSADIAVAGSDILHPCIEVLQSTILDHKTGQQIAGIVGNSFSSFVRDYDFSVLLLKHNQEKKTFSVPAHFGDLHGKLFQHFVTSKAYQDNFKKTPIICLSVSENKKYTRTANYHPILGYEYQVNESSLTEQYFKKMGLNVRYFLPPQSAAPFAFYFFGDLLNDYTPLELISTLSVMETFQQIYRPEIYNANAVAGIEFQPSLSNSNYSLTQIEYDREERVHLSIKQGQFIEKSFVQPYQQLLQNWAQSVNFATKKGGNND